VLGVVLLVAAASWQACAGPDVQAAIAGCTAAIETDRDRRAAAYYNRGIAWRAASQADRAQRDDAALDKAIADYDAAIRLNPDFAEAYVNRGIAWFDKGRYDQAIADATRAIALRPGLAEAFNNRALAWYKQGRYDRAQPDFDRTILLRKNYGNALILRGLPPAGSASETLPDAP
jgi:tetratricopeptide (TPR) repeat protein